jgi:hypothetical protein
MSILILSLMGVTFAESVWPTACGTRSSNSTNLSLNLSLISHCSHSSTIISGDYSLGTVLSDASSRASSSVIPAFSTTLMPQSSSSRQQFSSAALLNTTSWTNISSLRNSPSGQLFKSLPLFAIPSNSSGNFSSSGQGPTPPTTIPATAPAPFPTPGKFFCQLIAL